MKCTVQRGKRYRAKIEVPFFKRAFANESVVAARLADAGFENVVVQSAGAGVYWAWGTWPNEGATEDVDYVERLDEV